ncbi:hypothetical protein P9112_001735 [Eukaryota sp. TZLM1-RC]
MLLNGPQDLNLNDNICDLQLRLSTGYSGPKVINTRINKRNVCHEHDPQLLSLFPNVEVVMLGGESVSKTEPLYFLPFFCIELAHLSYLTSLTELVVLSSFLSQHILEGQIPLPQALTKLEVLVDRPLNVAIQLPKLRELIVHHEIPSFSEQNFPTLKFIQKLMVTNTIS